ncbi:MAG: hypothetical protein Q4G43_12000 [Mobilicoccus sp.]|nr:hypothetical protein [Mobilicoccus sp.]
MSSTSLDVAPPPVVLGLSIIAGLFAWGAFMSYMPGEQYAAWQVVGAAAVITLGVVITRVFAQARHAWATVVGIAGGFLLPWTWFSPHEGSQFVAGSVMLLVGLLLLVIVVTLVSDTVLRLRARAGQARRRRRSSRGRTEEGA